MSPARFALLTLLTALLVHLSAVWALPRIIMGVALHQVAGGGREANALYHPERIDAKSRHVVRPSPDLAYSACLFDLSSGPVRITAPVPDGYMSVSGFAPNSDNFFVVNDRETRPGPVDVVLVPAGAGLDPPAGARLIEAPSRRGLILIRSVIEDDAHWTELDRLRRRARCEALPPS